MRSRTRLSLILGGLLVISLPLVFFTVPSYLDSSTNTVLPDRLIPITPEARNLHAALRVVDLHDDLLLWNRDPLERHERGHTDVPRLLEGRTALQVFSAVTKSPRGLNYDANTGDSDNITLLTVLQRWPPATWRSRTQRALHQARRLRDAARRSAGALTIIASTTDLDAFLAEPNAGTTALGGILAIEGLHALDGQLAHVDTLYAAGYRMMGLTHFFDNEVAASAHGVSKGGLTELGRDVVRRMEALGIAIDVAHLAPAGVDEVLGMATRPVVVSHTGVQATCPGPRNLSDAQIRRVAQNGGLIGIGYWDGAICEVNAPSTARAIRHVATLVGVQHVALGSDFDGATQVPFDASQLVQMTQALLAEGFSEIEIRGIMGRTRSASFAPAFNRATRDQMIYTRLGSTGTKVSRICLGTMTYGSKKWRDWVLEEVESLPFFERALALGVNFFDTADTYSRGVSEEIVGSALRKLNVSRESVVIATKVALPMGEGPNDKGLSRKRILACIDASLKRLQMEYVDLYQIHRFDYETPIQETVHALNDVVQSGKARYIGASSMYAWQFARMRYTQRTRGWAPFVTMQNHYNLMYREEEREMNPLCLAEGVGLLPVSPLARGFLAGTRTRGARDATPREKGDVYAHDMYYRDEDYDVVDTVVALAKERGVPPAQIALAWLLSRPGVTAPIIGASKLQHLEDAVTAVDIQLSDAERARLEQPYQPHPVLGHN